MKLTILIITILFPFSINAQTKYYDKNDIEISKDQFNNQQLGFGELKVFNDSLKIGKIIPNRSETGKLDGLKFYDLINSNLNLKLEQNKPLVIVYYPGIDPCNSSGTATPNSKHQWYKELITKSNKVTPTNFLFIYKTKNGLKYTKKDTWHKDPKGIIEKIFFKYHYPCSSYTIIFNNTFVSYFGEFSKDKVLEDLKLIAK